MSLSLPYQEALRGYSVSSPLLSYQGGRYCQGAGGTQGQIGQIVADIRLYAKNPATLSGFSSYLLALPVACSITAFIILEPIICNLEDRDKEFRTLLMIAALGSLISFGLIYPTPVTIPLFETLPTASSPLINDVIAIPLSLILLTGMILIFRTARVRETEMREVYPIEALNAIMTSR